MMLEFLKNYYVFMLILMVISFLVPKEAYKKYLQFFVGVFIVVLLLKPVLEFFTMEDPTHIYDIFEPFNQKMKQLDLEIEEGENLYEHFFFEGEGE